MEIVGIVLVLALPVMAIAGFSMVLGARTRLTLVESRLKSIEAHLAAINIAPAAAPSVAPDIDRAPLPESEIPPETIADAPPVAPRGEPPEPVSGAIGGAAPDLAPAPAPPVANLPPIVPPPPRESFEERFGTRWVVWVGGLALALGGIFLVKYSIEAGLIGPGMRIVLGALLAAALIVGAEWARRREQQAGVTSLPVANIPAILTAAGTTVAFATVYAAYALYGFLSPPVAFLLLGVVALATLAAALLHGPALAGLGLVGAYVTPLLVSTSAPELLGALCLRRGGHRGGLHAGAHAAMALACAHRHRVRIPVDAGRARQGPRRALWRRWPSM